MSAFVRTRIVDHSMGNSESNSGTPTTTPTPNATPPPDANTNDMLLSQSKWDPCETVAQHNSGHFKEETWNGRPCIHLHWNGSFPDGGEQGTKRYGAAYWYKGTGYIQRPIHVWNEWLITWGMFPVDNGNASQGAEQIRQLLPCAGNWNMERSSQKTSGRNGRRVMEVQWDGTIPTDERERFVKEIPLSFTFRTKTYTNVKPVDSEVRMGTTYGFFEVQPNLEWTKPQVEWKYTKYDQVTYTFLMNGDFVTDDWATESRSIAIYFDHMGKRYDFSAPSHTYVKMWKVYGEFNIPVDPPPLTNWRIYAYKLLDGYPDTVELKYNVTPQQGLPGYNESIIYNQILEREQAFVPRDAKDYRLDTPLDTSNGLKTRPTWAFHEPGGNWSVGLNGYTSGKPLHIPIDSADVGKMFGKALLDMLLGFGSW